VDRCACWDIVSGPPVLFFCLGVRGVLAVYLRGLTLIAGARALVVITSEAAQLLLQAEPG
jgi:hypothetical protein